MSDVNVETAFHSRSGCEATTGLSNALQSHQLPHIFHGRPAVRDYRVVVFFEIELVTEFFLLGFDILLRDLLDASPCEVANMFGIDNAKAAAAAMTNFIWVQLGVPP